MEALGVRGERSAARIEEQERGYAAAEQDEAAAPAAAALLRNEVNIELNFPLKLRGARSRPYRRRFLQVNILTTDELLILFIVTSSDLRPSW